MESNVADSDVTAAIKNINQELLPRRINFVPAKYEYKMQINDSIVFAKSTDYYSICYGNTKKSSSDSRPTLYDPKKLGQIKNWSTRYHPGRGYNDSSNRGFATSVLYCLRSCPSFRQFQIYHKESCQRVGCTLCKIYRFFTETEGHGIMNFPLDLNVFDEKWSVGIPGDSAEFLNQLLNVLQSEEFNNFRSFQSVNEYSTAIGQMFRIESHNKLICSECNRIKITRDSYWTYFLPNRIDKSSLFTSSPVKVEDYICDACGKSVSCVEEFVGEPPLIFTIQVNNWDEKCQYRKKKFQASKYLNLTISSIKYHLVAFTDYNGNSSEGGKFNSIFLSSSGIWNSMINGKIQPIDMNSLSQYNPQLLFYSRDEPNLTTERATISRLPQQNKPLISLKEKNDEEEEENDEEDKASRMKSAKDALTKSIEKQLKRNLQQNSDSDSSNKVVVVDTTDAKSRKVDRKKITSNPAKNTMQMLLKQSRNVHETSTWDGIEVDKNERIEATEGWKEEAPDEWDQSLDKGHVRKIKNKRPPPIENPFDKAASQKKTPDDIWKEKKKNRNNKFNGNKKFHVTEEAQYAPITAPKKDIHLPKDEQNPDNENNENKTEIENNEEEGINDKNTEEEEAHAKGENEETHAKGENEEEEEEYKELNSEQLKEEEEEQIESNLIQEENDKLNDIQELGVNEYDEESNQEHQVAEPTQQRPPHSARASYNHSISPRTPRVPTEEEKEKASSIATEFIMGNEVTETDPFILALTIRNLNERYIVLGDGGSYDDTVRCAHAIDAAKAKHREVVIEMARNDSMNWVRIKKRQNKEDVKNWEDLNYRMQGTLNRKSKNAINEMKKRHQEERQLFEEEWASETRMKYYNKASDQLRQLRKLQIRLLQDRKFEESERVKSIAQKLEKDEVAANMLAWSQAKREAFLLMESRQRKQMDTLVKSIEVKKDEFLARKKNENIVLANRRRALKIQEMDARNPEKNWIRHHRNEGDIAFKEIGPGQRIKIDSSAQKKNIFTLAMPPPPKTSSSGTWRPITKRYKVSKLPPTKNANEKENSSVKNASGRENSSVKTASVNENNSVKSVSVNENNSMKSASVNDNKSVKSVNENKSVKSTNVDDINSVNENEINSVKNESSAVENNNE